MLIEDANSSTMHTQELLLLCINAPEGCQHKDGTHTRTAYPLGTYASVHTQTHSSTGSYIIDEPQHRTRSLRATFESDRVFAGWVYFITVNIHQPENEEPAAILWLCQVTVLRHCIRQSGKLTEEFKSVVSRPCGRPSKCDLSIMLTLRDGAD